MFLPPSNQRSGGFTLIEVILAIGIATGILVVALVFYSQAANLRGQLIAESERLAIVRLVMDRIGADLHAAFEQPQVGFTGSTDSMEFVIARAPDGSGQPGNAALSAEPKTDLRRVYYYLTASLEGTNFVVTGLDRTEESLLTKPTPRGANATGASAMSGPTTFSAATSASGLTATNSTDSAEGAEPLAETIRFARFRYWDGAAWLEAWDAPGLPPAVEVSLGLDPLPENDLPDAYPSEVFRRIIVVPVRAAMDDWWAGL
jgi:type II secretory pathway pseudopilin PulG